MEDKRVQKRLAIQQLVEISFDRENFMQAYGCDLSAGGIKVRMKDRLDAGSRVFIMLGVPQDGDKPDDIITFECVVVHSTKEADNGWTAGMQFDLIGQRERSVVDSYLKTLSA